MLYGIKSVEFIYLQFTRLMIAEADNFTGASVGKRKQYDANGDEMKYGRR